MENIYRFLLNIIRKMFEDTRDQRGFFIALPICRKIRIPDKWNNSVKKQIYQRFNKSSVQVRIWTTSEVPRPKVDLEVQVYKTFVVSEAILAHFRPFLVLML